METYKVANAEAAQETWRLNVNPSCAEPFTFEKVGPLVSLPDRGYWTYQPVIEEQHSAVPQGGSFKKIQKSGRIKMTPMYHRNYRRVNHLGKFTFEKKDILPWFYVFQCNGQVDSYDTHFFRPSISQEVTMDLSYARAHWPNAPYFRSLYGFNQNSIEAQKANAWQELFQTYNLGEELYELRESIVLVKSLISRALTQLKSAISAYKAALRQGNSKALDTWMEYRYGIMPIVYSIQDILKLSGVSGKYHTVRKRVSPQKVVNPNPIDGTCFYESVVDTSTCNITVKSRYSSSAAKKFDLVNVNPFTTAATVYPYAFVVRWFINLNSFLDSHIKSITTTSAQYAGVIAIKTSVQKGTYFRLDARVPGKTETTSLLTSNGRYFEETDTLDDYGRLQDVLLQTETIDDYERLLISPSETKLVFNPHLDIKRGIDALALSLPYLSQAFRKLL